MSSVSIEMKKLNSLFLSHPEVEKRGSLQPLLHQLGGRQKVLDGQEDTEHVAASQRLRDAECCDFQIFPCLSQAYEFSPERISVEDSC